MVSFDSIDPTEIKIDSGVQDEARFVIKFLDTANSQ